MTQLLTSVKSVEEAMLALYAGTNLIDLKNPDVGALGALDIEEVKQIVAKLLACKQTSVLLSATVGENHRALSQLVSDIYAYSAIGVDIIKVAISDLLVLDDCFDEMKKVIGEGIQLVAVFFAEDAINLTLLKQMAEIGFYGSMIDTKIKDHSLIDIMTSEDMSLFIRTCKDNALISGLAGSINETQIEVLIKHRPDFVGMRGGLCEGRQRTAGLSESRMQSAIQLLRTCNSSSPSYKNRSSSICN